MTFVPTFGDELGQSVVMLAGIKSCRAPYGVSRLESLLRTQRSSSNEGLSSQALSWASHSFSTPRLLSWRPIFV